MVRESFIEGFHGLAFGVMDGLITILGVVVGIAHATENPHFVVLAGVVAGVANAFGNSVGFYASELAERAEHIQERKEVSSMREVRRSSILSFLTSISVLVIPSSTFILLPMTLAVVATLVISTAVLFLLGTYVGRFTHASPLRFGLRYVLLGLTGAGLSLLIGDILKDILTFGVWIPPLP